MAVLDPLVTRLTKFRIPRGISVLLTYLVVFGVFGSIIGSIVPPLVEQTTSFAKSLPGYLENIGVAQFLSEGIITEGISQLGSVPGQVLRVGVSVLSNFVTILTILTFSFYLLLTREKINDQLGLFFGDQRKKKIGDLLDDLEIRLGGWARGQLLLMFIVGLATYLGLTLLGIPFSLPLALLAGIFEIIPYLGPIFAAVPAVLIGLGISPVMGLTVAALALAIQQLENYVLVPKIMEKSIGLSPIVILIALAIGARLAGVVGMLISVPGVITIQLMIKHYLASRESSEKPQLA